MPTEFGGDAADIGPRAVGFSRSFWNIGDITAEQFDQWVKPEKMVG